MTLGGEQLQLLVTRSPLVAGSENSLGITGPRGVPISDLEVHDVDDSSARARVVVLVLQIGQAHSFSSPTRQNLSTGLVLRL